MTVALVTGADGFIGRNLRLRLAESGVETIPLGRVGNQAELAQVVERADVVFHLAGVNRPVDPADFHSGNVGSTETLCAALAAAGSRAPIVYASSIQAEASNPYGASKRAAEEALRRHRETTGAAIHIFRLPNVFGKWARPNYNSAVATFCHNIVRREPIVVHDPAAPLRLVHIDDVVNAFIHLIDASPSEASDIRTIAPVYETTVGAVADLIRRFPESRDTLLVPPVGTGLVRALYATYLSYLRPADFTYAVPIHGKEDPRGIFVEMLKTPDAGQFSYFIAHPGVTRGNHYHHSKSEKFLVIAGTAHFGFRHVDTGETHEVVTRGGEGRIVETIPGWTHNITNIGDDALICMLWANEIFDRQRPDTIAMDV